MNGVHDMGGMHGFGPVVPELNEPWFHHEWERRAFGLSLAMGATGQWNLDQTRAAREKIPPADYLRATYYEVWVEGLLRLLAERQLVTEAEIAAGHPLEKTAPQIPALSAENVPAVLAAGSPTVRDVSFPARFAVGDAIRTRNLNPSGHTRLPRYCRGRRGTITAVRGAHAYPDARARGDGDDPQWLYGVRFEAAELFGPDTTASAVYVDCWEPYLEPASA